MPRTKTLCVCSLINKIIILYGHNLEGEIYFKHSPKCPHKTTGTFEWTGTGFQEKNMLSVPFKFQQKKLKVSTIQGLNKKPKLSQKVSVNRLIKNSMSGGQRN